MAPYNIVLIGFGKIAQDQHRPVIAASAEFRLAGVVSARGLRVPEAPTFLTAAEAYAALPDVEAVAICTPPHVRYALAREALDAGKHVLLEKPPALTVTELDDLTRHADARSRVLFATWHSQYNAAVDAAKARLAGQTIRTLHVNWREDVRRWHPGQEWIWDVGGFGVFDPGINALSILTKLMPGPVFVRSAELVIPSNRDMPIAARITFASPVAAHGATLTADFDWRSGPDSWTIDVETVAGSRLKLEAGGAILTVAGEATVAEPVMEYSGIYRRFAELLGSSSSEVDGAPFQLVADTFLVGRRVQTDAFED